jgi:hypothetical protein
LTLFGLILVPVAFAALLMNDRDVVIGSALAPRLLPD